MQIKLIFWWKVLHEDSQGLMHLETEAQSNSQMAYILRCLRPGDQLISALGSTSTSIGSKPGQSVKYFMKRVALASLSGKGREDKCCSLCCSLTFPFYKKLTICFKRANLNSYKWKTKKQGCFSNSIFLSMEIRNPNLNQYTFAYRTLTHLACGILINYWSMETLGTVDDQYTTSSGSFHFTNKIITVVRCISTPIRLQDHTQHGRLQKCTHLWMAWYTNKCDQLHVMGLL